MFGGRKLPLISDIFSLFYLKALNAVNLISQYQEEEGNKVTFV